MNASVNEVNGVGPTTARLLAEAGYTDLASIANAKPKALTKVRGIGEVRAAALRAEARRLLGDRPASRPTAAGQPSKRKQRSKRLRKQAKQLRNKAALLIEKAESAKSKKKRKRRLREAAELKAAAKKARRKAEKLLTK